jgi:hypothetical protein
MAKISVKIEDDNGNLLQEQAYELGDKLDNIDLIESSVEKLRSQLLPQVSKQLLIAGQEAYKKKQPKKQR